MLGGFQQGVAQREGKKQQLSELQLSDTHDKLKGQLASHQTKVAAAREKYGENSPEYKQAMEGLTQANQAYQGFFQKNPSWLRRVARRFGAEGKVLTPTPAPRISTSATEPGLPATTGLALPTPAITLPAFGPAVTVTGPKPPPAAPKGKQDIRALKTQAQAATGAAPFVTTKPQPVTIPAQEGVPIPTEAAPAYKTIEVGRAAYPGEYARGTAREIRERTQKRQAAEQAAAAQAAALPPSPEEQAGRQTQAEIANMEARIQGKVDVFKKFHPDATPEQIQQVTDIITTNETGARGPKETPEKYMTQLQVTEDADGKKHYWRVPLAAGEAPEEVDFKGQKLVEKPRPMPEIEKQRESFRLSHNIPSGQPLTEPQQLQFLREMKPEIEERLRMARESLSLRERESGMKDFLAIQKQMTPLERVIDTSSRADDYAANPSGPGDVALTLAFFDAIKTTGVRFTKQEQDFIIGSRGFMEGAQAKFESGFTGEVLAPDQRKLLAGIIKKSADEAAKQKGAITAGVAAFRPDVAKTMGAAAPPPAAAPPAAPQGGAPKKKLSAKDLEALLP
jgi:hypothetical protein